MVVITQALIHWLIGKYLLVEVLRLLDQKVGWAMPTLLFYVPEVQEFMYSI